MLDLDRFIIELDRLTTAVYFYDEIYGEQDTARILSALSEQASEIIQFSLHNDIVITLACLLFDGKAYEISGNTHEYLSHYNLVKKYESYIDSDLQLHRDEIAKIKAMINVKDYRDLVLTHKDKATLTGQLTYPKHNLETSVLLKILHESRLLFFGVRLKIAIEHGETTLPVTDCNVHRNGVGSSFLKSIKNITSDCGVNS